MGKQRIPSVIIFCLLCSLLVYVSTNIRQYRSEHKQRTTTDDVYCIHKAKSTYFVGRSHSSPEFIRPSRPIRRALPHYECTVQDHILSNTDFYGIYRNHVKNTITVKKWCNVYNSNSMQKLISLVSIPEICM